MLKNTKIRIPRRILHDFYSVGAPDWEQSYSSPVNSGGISPLTQRLPATSSDFQRVLSCRRVNKDQRQNEEQCLDCDADLVDQLSFSEFVELVFLLQCALDDDLDK